MNFDNPPQIKISFENDIESIIPTDFKNNPFEYVRSFGINIKNGEKKFGENNRLREDPTAVKVLPEWQSEEGKFILVAKIVNSEKGKVGESGDPFYEYNIIKYVRSLGLPAPKPVLSLEQNGNYLFLTEKIKGTGWYEKDSLQLTEKGWTDEEIQSLITQAEEKMKDLSVRFEEAGIIRPWKLKDMIFDINMETKIIQSIIPTDFERTKIKNK